MARKPKQSTEIPYDPEIRQEDTDKARETITSVLLPDASCPVLIRATGDCPRCKHPVWDEHSLFLIDALQQLDEAARDDAVNAVANALKSQDACMDKGDVQWDMRCNCGIEHPGHPEKDFSCGSTFVIRVVWP
jgi:hypothetical protein